MTVDIASIKAGADIVQIIGLSVELKSTPNSEFAGLCPFHSENSPSFTVNPAKQFYHCFGCGAHGDVFDFLREKDGMNLPQAAEYINGAPIPRDKPTPTRPPVKRTEWVSVKPPAHQPSPPSFRTAMGEPVAKWVYRDTDGEPIGYVCRYQDGAKKVPLTWTYGSEDGTNPDWRIKGFGIPRPLFGLDRLADRPDAQVIIGEGEKATEAIGKLFPAKVNVGWPGGTNGLKHVDLSPMTGRNVVLMPDADEPGRAAMETLKPSLEGIGCTVKIVYPEASRPKGWDLADGLAEGWTPKDALNWVKARLNPDPEAEGLSANEEMVKLSDVGLAQQFAKEYGNHWKYTPETGKWLEWVGDRWRLDDVGAIQESAINHLKIVEKRTTMLTPAQRKSLLSNRAVDSIMKLSKSAPAIATPQSLMDANPWLLGVPGGVIDLKTGRMQAADPDQLVSKQCTVSPTDGQPKIWLEFLDQVLMGRQDQIQFLQRFAGYALIGKLFEPGLAFLHGSGGNGKGVVLGTLIGIMGDYAVSADFGTFAEQEYGERHSTDVARLAGARLVITEEGKQDQKLNEGLIKKLTGGGKMTARFMQKDNFEFEFVAKIIVASNHKPALSSVGEDMKRRLNMIPFDYTVPEDQRDQHLGEKLKEEYPRILNWMIEGCMHWQEMDGLHAPESIKAVSRGFIQSQDPMAEFLSECCIVGKGQEILPSVYREYKSWCDKNGERTPSRRQFQDRLGGRNGINFTNGALGKMVDGLTLKAVQ